MARSSFENLWVYQLSEQIADAIWNIVNNRRFVRIARGSLKEAQHFLRRAYKRNLVNNNHVARIKQIIDELALKLNAYLNSIVRKCNGQLTTDNSTT